MYSVPAAQEPDGDKKWVVVDGLFVCMCAIECVCVREGESLSEKEREITRERRKREKKARESDREREKARESERKGEKALESEREGGRNIASGFFSFPSTHRRMRFRGVLPKVRLPRDLPSAPRAYTLKAG